MIRRFCAVACAAVLAIGATACGKNEDETMGNVNIRTAYGTEKILRNDNYTAGKSTLTYKTFKNEYESAQIILTPDYDVKNYSVTLSDLTCGDEVFPKENFEVYHEKYIEVETDYELMNDRSTGWYPEALIPYENAARYGETSVKSGENQGIWITLKCPKGQAAGTYTGKFTVDVDGKKTEVPVEVTVYDYEISDECHQRSSYSVYIDALRYGGEGNATQEMEKKYVDNLLDFRLSPQQLPTGKGGTSVSSKDEVLTWLEYAVEYSMNVKCSYICIPLCRTTTTYKDMTITCVDGELYEWTLRQIAERSIAENINLFEKMDIYMIFFDEAESNGADKVAGLEYTAKQIRDIQEKLATELKNAVLDGTWLPEATYAEDFALEIIEEMRTVQQLCTGDGAVDNGIEGGLKFDYPITFVGVISYMSDPDYLEYYREYLKEYNEYYDTDTGELWTYTAVGPFSPFTNLHLDTDFYDQRALGWLMQQNNVTGHLYWYTNLYYQMKGWNTNMVPLQDAYSTTNRFPWVNGDGFLTYPGTPYGVDGPINSTRLYTIRDSMEDYEVLYLLEQEYKKAAENEGREYDRAEFESFVTAVTANFYKNSMIRPESEVTEDFFLMRDALNAALDAITKTGTYITEFKEGDTTSEITFSAPTGVTIAQNGATVRTVADGNRVKYTVILDRTVNAYLDATIQNGSDSVRLNFGAGKKLKVSAISSAMISAETVGETKDDTAVQKVSLPAASEESTQKFELELSAYNLHAVTEFFKIKIYNYGEEVTLQLMVSNENAPTSFRTFKQTSAAKRKNCSITLKPGWNTVELNVWGMTANIEKNGDGMYCKGRFDKVHALRFVSESESPVQIGFATLITEDR